MILKVFTQPGCYQCPAAKQLGEKVGKHLMVEFWDVTNADGLAEASFYNVYSTPSLILASDTGKELAGWRAKVSSTEENFLGAVAQAQKLAHAQKKPFPEYFGKTMIQEKYRFHIKKEKELRSKIAKLKSVFKKKYFEKDLILQPYGDKFVDRGVFIRLRERVDLEGGKKSKELMLRTFEYQGKAEVREAVEFDLDKNQEGAENLMRLLQLLRAVIGTVLEKTSESYEVRIKRKKIFLRIDKLERIPSKIFLEMFAYCDKKELKKFKEALSLCREKLGLSDKMLIVEPYYRLLAKEDKSESNQKN